MNVETTETVDVVVPEAPKHQPKRNRDSRISQLLSENKGLRTACIDLNAELYRRQLENIQLLERLSELESAVDPREYQRLKNDEIARAEKQKQNWQNFLTQCRNARGKHPDFDACVKAIGNIPLNWIQVISELPNGPDFIVFLGRSTDFLSYLLELKDEVAIKRIREAAASLSPHFKHVTRGA